MFGHYISDVNVALKSNKQKNFGPVILKSLSKILGSGVRSVSKRYGSADPDPYQNVKDPQHWNKPRKQGKIWFVILKKQGTYILGLLLELLDGPLVDAAALVDEMAGGGGLARVHMANHNDVDVNLFLSHG